MYNYHTFLVCRISQIYNYLQEPILYRTAAKNNYHYYSNDKMINCAL